MRRRKKGKERRRSWKEFKKLCKRQKSRGDRMRLKRRRKCRWKLTREARGGRREGERAKKEGEKEKGEGEGEGEW